MTGALLALVSVLAAPPGGQLVQARLTADLASATEINVHVRYTLQVEPGTRTVPFALLRWAGITVDQLQASALDASLTLNQREQNRRTHVTVELPESLRNGEANIELRYRVSRASAHTGQLHIPVLSLLWSPADASPEMFAGEIRMPPGMRAAPVFPVASREVEVMGDQQLYHVSLQVIPSVISLAIDDVTSAARVTGADALAPGFVFWGLFVTLAGIAMLYVLWLWRIERQ